MEFTFYQIDAFTNNTFGGNPAAVFVLDSWLSENQMQAIAGEMNLSETAFVGPTDEKGANYAIRWFTPTVEIELCGHATLASAHVLFKYLGFSHKQINFHSMSGILSCEINREQQLQLDFPAQLLDPIAIDPQLEKALGSLPAKAMANDKRLQLVYESSAQILELQPDSSLLKKFPQFGICCTAPGTGDHKDVDFVCRFFAPAAGIDEDPVTGSAYTSLVPYYADTLNKQTFNARQLSSRGGELKLTRVNDRIKIAGEAVTVIKGTFYL
ncbi:PhzF family phenazine biosynthesis protein [Teredinibacter haidensis]|uniref:PhzF family phenazine biosynthesis protein n=1 Tax=Teredinibacter haidensis TaxID=2731755 RepID=UPI000948A40B|nr:PhzF family phenazine biosynthesis protein [Teredinibacter haidensis]